MFNTYRKIIKSLSAFVIVLFATFGTANAQLDDIGAFLKAGVDDATILTKEYLKPFPTGLGTGLNAGWNEAAAPKKTLGFSLQIRPSLSFVPTSDQSFNISELGLEKIEVAPGEESKTPTIAGNNSAGPELVVRDDEGNELTRFNMPQGTGVSFVPAPVIQASIGLVKGTDLSVRYFPETKLGDFGNIGIFGAAVKHDITQWLPAGTVIPVDISLMAGFNRIALNGNLDLQPEGPRNPQDPSLTSNPTPDFDDQSLETNTNTFVVNALVGKSLPLISVYGGVGYQKATFDLDIKGDYPINTSVAGQTFHNVVNDPISFELDSKSNIHMLGGFRFRVGVLAFYGEATVSNYFTANAGVGISFR